MSKILNFDSGIDFSGQAVKKARLFRGLTMDELARKCEVSHQMISKYENNRSVPTIEVIKKMSSTLNFPIGYFYSNQEISPDNNGFYRKASKVSKRDKTRVAELATYANNILNVIKEFVILPKYNDPIEIRRTEVFEDISFEYIEEITLEIRNKFNFGRGPLINLTGFMESLGIIILFSDISNLKIDAYTTFIDETPIIILNSNKKSASRIRFNLAHELGHILLHRDYRKKYENGGKYMRIEEEANFFAGTFLVPEQGLIDDLTAINLQHLIVLKEHWQVSIAMLITRANQCNFFSDTHALHLWQQLSRNGWRKSEPLDDFIEIEKPVLIKQALDIFDRKNNKQGIQVISSKLKLFPEVVEEILYFTESGTSQRSNLKLL